MNTEQAKEGLLKADAYFKSQHPGYKTWGDVEVLQIAQRVSANEFLLTDARKPLEQIMGDDISLQAGNGFIAQIFSSRKKVNTVLITKQQFASQLREDVPAILDDQAQLLGVSIRRAKNETDIAKALSGRFAANLPDGHSICIGSSIEDAYVAAQLLEKTAKVFIEAKHIGGAIPINKIEAWLMQQYYLFKYSKEAVKNK